MLNRKMTRSWRSRVDVGTGRHDVSTSLSAETLLAAAPAAAPVVTPESEIGGPLTTGLATAAALAALRIARLLTSTGIDLTRSDTARRLAGRSAWAVAANITTSRAASLFIAHLGGRPDTCP